MSLSSCKIIGEWSDERSWQESQDMFGADIPFPIKKSIRHFLNIGWPVSVSHIFHSSQSSDFDNNTLSDHRNRGMKCKAEKGLQAERKQCLSVGQFFG